MELTEKIAQLLEEKFATDEAFNDCFIIEIELKPIQKLNVFLDCDSGLDFSKCQKLSRFLEGHLDTNGWLGEKYTLEVSSPGIGRPFKFLRQYTKNIGRTVAVTLLDKTKKVGVLKDADETKVVIEQEVVEMDGKKKKKVMKDIEIPMAEVDKTSVEISF